MNYSLNDDYWICNCILRGKKEALKSTLDMFIANYRFCPKNEKYILITKLDFYENIDDEKEYLFFVGCKIT